MSFGFGAGDFVLFTQFATKAILALKNEGGSKPEYMLAQRQCEDFLSVMNELQSLDLSNVPDSFRAKLEEYSTNVKEFIDEFRKSIAKYENAMGKDSDRGFLKSAPRKVQWAFMAADDLGKFRQSLAGQLDLVKIVISMSILSILGGSHNQEPSQSLSSRRRPHQNTQRVNGYLDWNPYQMDGGFQFRKIEDLTDLVYERLLSRPGITGPLKISGRVNTLPDNFSLHASLREPHSNPEGRELQYAVESKQISTPPQLESGATENESGGEESNPNTLEDEINEYLVSMNLEELSDQEREYINLGTSASGLLLLEAPRDGDVGGEDHGQNQTSSPSEPERNSRSKSKTERFSSSKNPFKSFGSGIDTLTAFALAANVIQFAEFATQIAFKLSNISRSSSEMPQEVYVLVKQITQYSRIMQIAGQIIRTSMLGPQDELPALGMDILSDSQRTMEGVQSLLQKYGAIDGLHGRVVGAVRAVARWQLNKNKVMALVDQIESLKTNVSIMLQLYQVKMTENHMLLTEKYFQNSEIQAQRSEIALKSLRAPQNLGQDVMSKSNGGSGKNRDA